MSLRGTDRFLNVFATTGRICIPTRWGGGGAWFPLPVSLSAMWMCYTSGITTCMCYTSGITTCQWLFLQYFLSLDAPSFLPQNESMILHSEPWRPPNSSLTFIGVMSRPLTANHICLSPSPYHSPLHFFSLSPYLRSLAP